MFKGIKEYKQARFLISARGREHGYSVLWLNSVTGKYLMCSENVEEGIDNRIKMNKTLVRVETGPWAEGIQTDGGRRNENWNDNAYYKQGLSISEARAFIEEWKEARQKNGLGDADLDLSRILNPASYEEYANINDEWK